MNIRKHIVVLTFSLATGIFIYILTLLGQKSIIINIINTIIPIVLSLICIWTSYNIIKVQRLAIYTPVPWFLLAWVLYHGFGGLAPIFLGEIVLNRYRMGSIAAEDILMVNLLNTVGLFAFCVGFYLFSHIKIFFKKITLSKFHDPWRVALIFLILGAPIRVFLDFPRSVGLIDINLPGFIIGLAGLMKLSIIPLKLASQSKYMAKIILWAVFITEIGMGLVQLAKINIIITILILVLAEYFTKSNLKQVMVIIVGLIIVYSVFLQDFILWGRIHLQSNSARSYDDILYVIKNYNRQNYDLRKNMWWYRLCYIPEEIFVMSQYDIGDKGDSFILAKNIVLPRIIFPNKPVLTIGADFYKAITGVEAPTHTAAGIFAEAYWNGGWLFVLLTGLFVGALVSILGKANIHLISTGKWLYLPLIFAGIFSAMRLDDWFVATYMQAPLNSLTLSIILNVLFSRIVFKKIK